MSNGQKIVGHYMVPLSRRNVNKEINRRKEKGEELLTVNVVD